MLVARSPDGPGACAIGRPGTGTCLKVEILFGWELLMDDEEDKDLREGWSVPTRSKKFEPLYFLPNCEG